MHNFKELKIWQKSREFVKTIYQTTQDFPSQEKYDLVSQIRRSAISIPSNIAEGSGRGTDKDFVRFINISISSAFELETQLILSTDLGYLNDEKANIINNELREIQKMIFGFRKTHGN